MPASTRTLAPDGLSIESIAEQLFGSIQDARGLGISGLRSAATTFSTKWCLSFIQTFFDLGNDLCEKAGLPEEVFG